MKLLYTAEHLPLVWHARNLVEEAGYACVLRNEYAGGGAGELSPFDVWPELWIVEDLHYERARTALAAALTRSLGEPPWQCRHCGERNEGSFELCWKCGVDCRAPLS